MVTSSLNLSLMTNTIDIKGYSHPIHRHIPETWKQTGNPLGGQGRVPLDTHQCPCAKGEGEILDISLNDKDMYMILTVEANMS